MQTMLIGERIKAARKELGLTQTEFGLEIGINTSTVSRIEAGVIAVSNQVRVALVKIMGINAAWLDTGEGEIFKEE